MPETTEAVVVLIFLIAPGFLCWKLLGSRIPPVFVSETYSIMTALLLSVLVHILVLPLTISIAGEIATFSTSIAKASSTAPVRMNWVVFAWAAFVLFGAPVIIALGLSSMWKAKWSQGLLRRFGLSQVENTPEAWDWFFLTQEKGCWIVAEMEDGSRVGGQYGANSFASITPHGKDLYLETVYDVDPSHNFGEKIADSVGVWINGAKVKSLYFYRVEERGEK